MQLKSLTINGFKSFADKTKIEFRPGITGVVGPNGSGKSNIIEALRWVLGEQSAKGLRGGKMSDVIFVGAQNRAAQNRAEVTLELDNSDGFLKNQPANIALTRRIYRNGESEFLLNQKNIRLRDILTMFMDTGLGKESFSIISQGKVEAIFNSKPQERRALIEETAGVLKYKNEKIKAQQELAETTDHLDRVSDIITELYQQKEPLEQQASIARDYLEQKKQLDYYDLSNLVIEIEEKTETKQALQKKLTQLQLILDKQSQQATKQEQQTVKLDQQRQQIEQQIDTLQAKLIELTRQKERIASRQDMQQQEQRFQAQRQTELSQQIEENQANLVNLKQQAALFEDQCLQLEKQKNELQQKLTEFTTNEKTTPEEIQQQVEQLNEQIVITLQQETKLQSQQAYLKQEQQRYLQQQDQATEQLAKLDEQITKLSSLIAQKETQIAQLVTEIDTRQADLAKLEQQQQQLSILQDEQVKRWYQASEILQQAKTRRETLENISESYVGYYQGVKSVLQAKKHLPGIIGAVAELLDVPTKYAKAIETALGGQLQNVVTQDEQSAKNAIEYLTTKKLGKATFLPLTTVKSKKLSAIQIQLLENLNGYEGIGADLVQINTSSQSVLHYLLGNVVIAKDLQTALIIAKKLNYATKVVTLNGEIVNAGGSLSGGANKQQKIGLLEQKQQLVKLSDDIMQMQAKLTTLEKIGQKTKQQLQEVKQQVQTATTTIAKIVKQQDEAVKQKEVYATEIKHYQTTKNDLTVQLNQIATAMQDFKQQAKQLDNQAQALQVNLVQLQQQQELKQESLKNIQDIKADSLKVSAQYEQQIAVIVERLQAKQIQLKEISNQQVRLQEVIQKAQTTLTQLNEVVIEEGQSQEDLQAKQTQLANELISLKQTLSQLQAQRTQIHETIATAKTELTRLNQLQHSSYEEQRSLSVQEAKQTTLLEGYLTELSQKYALTFEKAKQQPRHLDSVEVKRKLKLLKLGIEELGEVNLGAISEYERISERYEFLSQQQADLLAAKAQLTQSMNEMDQEVKIRFKQTFEQVAMAFTEIFPQMFGGGQAYLSLTDPNDLLTTGIEITAQPPGKKAQQLSLLSGGERSLTAITLLFAILKVRPVPFVVLDEAEAALDDANVARYAQYLRHYNEQTQFIVITHRKGTMMNADVLYGVTMQEAGVSQMVSVSLEDVI